MKRRMLVWALVLVALSAGLAALLALPQVRHWQIVLPEDAAGRVQAAQLTARLEPFSGARFLTLSLSAVRQAVVAHPWVADARIMRVWPDTVRIEVRMQKPVARWGTNGLVNGEGEVFHPPQVEEYRQLLQLAGPQPDDARDLLAMAVWLRSQTALTDWRLTALRLHRGGSVESHWWPRMTLWLDMRRYRAQFSRFMAAWPQVKPELRQAARGVDLRYSNGFSIRTDPLNGTDEEHGAQKTEQ